MMEKIEWYQEVLELEPSSKVFFPLAKLLQNNNQPKEAVATLRQGLDRHPEFFEARLMLIDLLESSGRSDEALQEVERLGSKLDLYPGFWQAWAGVCEQQGQMDVSVALRLLAVSLSGKDVSLMDVLQQGQALSRKTRGAFEPLLGRLTAQADRDVGPMDNAQIQRLLPHARSSALQIDKRAGRARLTDPLARIDLGGVAKLPILQAGLDTLTQAGLQGCMINGGGDVLASRRADGQPWRIGVRDGVQPDRLLAVVPLKEGIVASSGDYERYITIGGARYHHIIDPKTGRPTAGIHGVTLVAETVDQVNGLGTAAMVAGPAGASRSLQVWGAPEFIVMHADRQVEIGGALASKLLPPPGQKAIRRA